MKRKLRRLLADKASVPVADLLSSAHRWELTRMHWNRKHGHTAEAKVAHDAAEAYRCDLAEHLTKFG